MWAQVWGSGWAQSIASVALCVAAAKALGPFVAESDQVMLLLLGVVWVAYRYPLRAALLGVGLSVGAFNFFFVEPHYTFAVADVKYLITFGVMGVVGVVLSGLAARVKRQAEEAAAGERRAAALYELSRVLSGEESPEGIAQAAVEQLGRVFRSGAVVWLGDVEIVSALVVSDAARRSAQALLAGQEAPALEGLVLWPLSGASGVIGALGFGGALAPEERALAEVMARQLALAVERAREHEARQAAQRVLDAERLRSTLLSSVSHDLRTPLGTILGSTGALLSGEVRLDDAGRRALLESVHAEAERLEQLVRKVLELTRITGGAVKIDLDWHIAEELVGAVLGRPGVGLGAHRVEVEATAELACFDATLVGMALTNLLENAGRHSPPGSRIAVRARREEQALVFEVEDEGPGLDAEEVPRLFEAFYRGRGAQGLGSGLGLAICKAVAEVHGGAVEARPGQSGGACFALRLPQPRSAPSAAEAPAEEDVEGGPRRG